MRILRVVHDPAVDELKPWIVQTSYGAGRTTWGDIARFATRDQAATYIVDVYERDDALQGR